MRVRKASNCLLSNVFLPLQPATTKAAIDPERRFATIDCCIAKGLFDHIVGNPRVEVSIGNVEPSQRRLFSCAVIEALSNKKQPGPDPLSGWELFGSVEGVCSRVLRLIITR